MEPLSDFAVSTHAELLRLAAEARAKCPGHVCPDKAPCRHCAEYRRIHALIDDHLAQLRGEPEEPTPLQSELLASYAADSIEDRTAEPICRCGRAKFLLQGDALGCLDCDCPPLPRLGLGGAS